MRSSFVKLTRKGKRALISVIFVIRQQEIEAGQQRQEQIRELLFAFGQVTNEKLFKDRKAFLTELRTLDRQRDVRLSAPELKAVLAAFSERDETAEICQNKEGEAETDIKRLEDDIMQMLKEVTA